MSRLFIITMMLFSSTCVKAQQSLDDPRYVYSLDAQNREARNIALNINQQQRVAILYNGKLYKDVNYTSFIYDSALVYHAIRYCFSRREKKQLTKERGIKNLYIVGEYEPWRKYKTDHPEDRKYMR